MFEGLNQPQLTILFFMPLETRASELVGVKPEMPVHGLIPAYCARKLFSTYTLFLRYQI